VPRVYQFRHSGLEIEVYETTGGIGDRSDTLGDLNRVHRRIFRLNDKIQSIESELRLVHAELGHHRSINDDAQRDAAIGNYIDREEAGLTAGDVRRFEKTIRQLQIRRDKLSNKRDRLLTRLPV
jgi:hypothetical protein